MTKRRYFKAVRPDLTDFHTGTIRYEPGTRVTHPAARRVKNDPSTYLSVSTVATDCTGFRWPCRLVTVEGVGRPVLAEGLPHKRCFSAVDVVDELPAHLVFGPQGEEVAALIDRAGRLSGTEIERLYTARGTSRGTAWDAAWAAAQDAAWAAAWSAARAAAREAALDAAWDAAWAAARAAARDAAWAAAGDAARALLVRDLIGPDQFDTLYGPWRSVIEKGDDA